LHKTAVDSMQTKRQKMGYTLMHVSGLALLNHFIDRTEGGLNNVHHFSKKVSATQEIPGVTEVCKN